jgi:hypothetical protein
MKNFNNNKPAFDSETKIKELKEKIENISLEEMKNFCNSWKIGYFVGLHKYSFFNYCIASFQLRELGKSLSVIAPFKVWADKKMYVKKGEKALHIFAPIIKNVPVVKGCSSTIEIDGKEVEQTKKIIKGFRLVPVFDIGQTDGKIEDLDIEKGGLKGDWTIGQSKINFDNLKSMFDIPVKIYPIAETSENGYTDGTTISLLEKPENEMISTYIHELAHFNLHFSKSDDYKRISREAREVEAESVSYLVCSALGLENTKAPLYIKGWGDFSDTVRIKKIMNVTEKILSVIFSGGQETEQTA